MGQGASLACFNGGNGLQSAILEGEDGFVKQALSENPKLAAATLSIRDGSTAAHLAAAEGRLDYLKLLVSTYEAARKESGRKLTSRGVPRLLNRRNMHGQSALMLACKFGHADVVTWLLQQGANPMLFDSIHSRVCLHYAALYGAAQCIDALFAEDAFVRMSAGPALLKNAHVLDSQGFHKYIDVRAAMGFASVHMAASQGHWQSVVALLRHGASLSVRCYGVLRADFAVPARWKPNSTPLHIAAARGSTSMVKHMLQSFAEQMAREPGTTDVRLMRDFADMRPVDIARAYGYQRIAAMLDPARPVELLAYITSSHWGKNGPPSLSALAARALRRRLLQELDALEPAVRGTRCRSRAPSAAPTARAPQPPPSQGQNGFSGDCGATDSADASGATSDASQASEQSTSSGGGSAPLLPQPSRQPATSPPAGNCGVDGSDAAAASLPRPRQPSGLLPALSAAAPGPPRQAGDPFAASGAVAPPAPQQSLRQQYQQQRPASSVFSSFSPFSGYTGRGFDDEPQHPEGGALPRSNSLLSLSFRPLPAAEGSAASPQQDRMADVQQGRSSMEAGFPGRLPSLQGRRSSRHLATASARSLAAGGEAPGSPPGVRRPSALREGLAAGAARTSSILRLGSGALRRRGSEMILDARAGDVYTGGDGSPSPGVEANLEGQDAQSERRRTSADGSAAPDGAPSGEAVVLAELPATAARPPLQFLVRRASTGLARAPSAASVAGEDCDICFDAGLEVAIRACGHQFCVACLRGVCEAAPDKTPRCPFCRRVVDAVVPAARRAASGPGPAGSAVGGEAAAPSPPEMALDAICNAAIAAQA